ncbi:carbamoyl phosphate synthetase [Pedobacter ginsengisoli]|uniref:Carbamoyl phosphate synthetase n=1 Tax=Pedobacter ginsengisoli TaxID=363852 RepID=A0A2D1U750_9SPHI|nr:DUF4134 domain-containing protein [Pedobacter ginsengisoli]ATP57410.1 carbamoyl phosphate synthetase [Pedobacter ginsengisoli]
MKVKLKRYYLNLKKYSALLLLSLIYLSSSAQDGNAGIQKANTEVRSYFQSGVQLMYAVGALVGLIGAVKVYQKWNGGDQDTSKVAAAWFGSCIFLVVVATIIKSFFGV